MLLIFSIFMFITQCFSQESQPCENEALFLRRISEFYEEKEFNVVFAQGEDFLKKYPNSLFADDLRVLLGDLSLDRQLYSQALSYYTKIKETSKKEQIFFNILECYYQRKDFEKIIEACRDVLASNKSLDKEQKEKIQNTYALSLFKWMQEDETRNYQINEAVTVFESLKNTKYDLVAKEHLAYLYTEKKAYKTSANLYLELASKCPEKQEDYLFSAAEQARKYDKDLAMKTYGQICYLEGSRAKDAAFNRLLLFFEEKKYGDILVAKGQFSELIDKEKQPLLHYYVARSYFELEDFIRAKDEFVVFLDKEEEKDLRISAQYYLLSCGQKLKDVCIMDDVILRIEKEFKEDKLYLEALFARALLQKEKENFLSAETDFSKIVESTHPFTRKQEMLFEWAHMYLKTEKYEKAYPLFKQYIELSEDKSTLPLAWHYFIYCSIKEAESKQEDTQKTILEKDLTNVLKRSLSVGEKAEYLYLLGKTRFQLKNYEASMQSFAYLIKAFPKTKYLSKSYVYLGYNYKEKDHNLLKFTECIEKALQNAEQLSHLDNLHLALYNAYYKLYQDQEAGGEILKKIQEDKKNLSQKKSEIKAKAGTDFALNTVPLKVVKSKKPLVKNKKASFKLIDSAAEHLYSLYILNPDKVSLDNRFWLASFYHANAKRKKDNKLFIEKGIAIYQENLKSFKDKSLAEGQVYLESHFLRLAELYQLAGNKESEIQTLNDLKKKYESSPNLSWEFQNKTYYYLASAIKKEDVAKAIILFDIVGSSPYSRSTITNLSILEGAKLKKQAYIDLSKDDPKYIDLVCKLKNLSLKRSINTEPVHLEASLELIDLMIDKTMNREEQVKKKLGMLSQMKQRFLSEDDILSKDYHTQKNKLPSKGKLFNVYMSFLDREMLLLQSELCEESEKKQLENEANRLLKEIEGTVSSYPFLKERIES